MKKNIPIILSCEHAGNNFPKKYDHLFSSKYAQIALNSHRGYDIGAIYIAEKLASLFRTSLIKETTTRLLIDLNRTEHSRTLFSEFTDLLPTKEKRELFLSIHQPHTKKVHDAILESINNHKIAVHIAVHSFTPILNGIKRNADIGILYDPQRIYEKKFCSIWHESIKEICPSYPVRKNYPYTGYSDCLARYFRKSLSSKVYLGIELEINQRLLMPPFSKIDQDNISINIYHSLINTFHLFGKI